MCHVVIPPILFRAGTVFHTGDWKFDPAPLIGPPPDFEALQRCACLAVEMHCFETNILIMNRIGDEKVLALIGDSTNALHEVALRFVTLLTFQHFPGLLRLRV